MTENDIMALVMLAAGLLLGLVVARRIRTGKSYISNPAMAVMRKEDPFSFWLSVAPPLFVSLALIAAGMFGIVHG
jgi:hypothetical protein